MNKVDLAFTPGVPRRHGGSAVSVDLSLLCEVGLLFFLGDFLGVTRENALSDEDIRLNV